MVTMIRALLILFISFSVCAGEDLEQLSNKVPFIEPLDRSELNLQKKVKLSTISGYYIQTINNQRVMHLLPKMTYTFNNDGKLTHFKKDSISIEEERYIYNEQKLTFNISSSISSQGNNSKTTYKIEYNDKDQVIKIISSSQGGHFDLDFNSCSIVKYFPFEQHIESCFGETKSIYKMNENNQVKSIKTTFPRPGNDSIYDQSLTTFEYADGLLIKSKKESSVIADIAINYEYDKNQRIIKTYHSRKSDNPILRNRDKNFLLETEYPEFDENGNPLKIITMTYALKDNSKQFLKETVTVYDYEYYP